MHTLITNSGIQSLKVSLEINLSEKVLDPQHFCEFTYQPYGEDLTNPKPGDPNIGDRLLDFGIKVPNSDAVVCQKPLKRKGMLDEQGRIKKEFSGLQAFEFGSLLEKLDVNNSNPNYYYTFTNKDIVTCLKSFENNWIPFPYFKRNNSGKHFFGPYSWCRCLIKDVTPELEESDDYEGTKVHNFELFLAFDTTTIDDNEEFNEYFTPKYSDAEQLSDNTFSLCLENYDNDEDPLLSFIASPSCKWVWNYLHQEGIHKKNERRDITNDTEFGIVAKYLYLIKYLGQYESYLEERLVKLRNLQSGLDIEEEINENKKEILAIERKRKSHILPSIKLFSDRHPSPINVNLVLDIGNANTCGVLFEDNQGNNFDFNTVKKLQLKDLSISNFGDVYDNPFSMRLAFSKASFGVGYLELIDNYPLGPKRAFNWPSLVRIGKEAERLINIHNLTNKSENESSTNCSSPKRYLWDKESNGTIWEFVNTEISRTRKDATFEGITEQFDLNGDYSFERTFSFTPNYSRKSLMTFVYLEILLHAISQINSDEFRDNNVNVPRKLDKVIITCPTSIVKEEQITLRKCAEEAILAIQRFYDGSWKLNVIKDSAKPKIQVVPSPDDLSRDVEEKVHWNFDESTCSQMVFLYSEIAKKYLGKSKLFFDTFGKKIGGKSSLTLGSIDIGGGTSDLMICRYDSKSNGVVTPKPIFHESYNLAGDDFLQKVISSVVLEGETVGRQEVVGVIKKYAVQKGCNEVISKVRELFGSDQKNAFPETTFRKNINTQIFIPIALHILKEANSDNSEIKFSFEDVFSKHQPNAEIMDYLSSYFGSGFDFKEIEWNIRKDVVFQILKNLFDPLIRQISLLFRELSCDFVLLSGKITRLPVLRESFLEFYPISPDRIISLDEYYAGDWYQFSKDGRIQESKTIVPFGATISLMGAAGRLPGFNLDISELKEIRSTADFVGLLDLDRSIKKMLIKPDLHETTLVGSSLPLAIGFKQIPQSSYPSRPIYKIEFDKFEIEKYLRKVKSNLTEKELELEIMAIENSVEEVVITRDSYEDDKEKISVELFGETGEISSKFFRIKLKTLFQEEGYWADTGKFELYRS